jgi:glycosyltransferase involved in cell wall biosynthesis
MQLGERLSCSATLAGLRHTNPMPHSFAYLFERFPSFVQTFVYREAAEMVRQEMNPLLISLRRPDDNAGLAADLEKKVVYLPEVETIRSEIDAQRAARKLPGAVHRAIPKARQQKDSNRMFEAAWIGVHLKREGIKHVHAHFGGMAARTAWWLRELYGISYSFTGHANDIFCETEFPVSNTDLISGAKFVVTETDYAREWLQKKYPRAAGRVFRVYNGVDRDFPAREPAEGAPRVLSVGRLVEKKGFDDLIEACRLLRERGRAFECAIVGEGPLAGTLQAQIDRSGLSDSVWLLGSRSQEEVRQLLARCQLFVLPCVPESTGGSDNLPTVIMEAMMCGLPVISTRLAGVPEMIQHSENGLLVAPRNPSALSTTMEQLLRDTVLAEKLGTRAHGTAVSKFALENTTRMLKHLLVKHGGVRPPAAASAADPKMPAEGWRSWTPWAR